MHVEQVLYGKLAVESIHLRRLDSFFAGCRSLLEGNKLTVTGLGRNIINTCKTKNNIKKMDRLVGNEHLYEEDMPTMYKVMSKLLLRGKKRPIIIVDWSSATPGERFQILRASFAVEGRAVTVYQEVYELCDYNNPKVHRNFLKALKKILPKDCCPIIVTDAGYSVPWFADVRKLGWDFIGRVSGTSSYEDSAGNKGKIRDLLNYKYARVKGIGKVSLTKRHHFDCYLQIYKKTKKGRVCSSINGARSGRNVSVKAAKRESQAWVIASSLGNTYTEAKRVIEIYSFRMQIEESFRDLKSHQFGVALRDSRTQGILRLSNLLLIEFVASVMFWLIGLCAKTKGMHRAFQANTIKTRNVLSVTFLAKEIIKHNKHLFKLEEWVKSLDQLREIIKYA